jgi:hypothetical protein
MSASPWPRYWIATRILAHRRQLPPRPADFLDWAYTVGLLRLSGIATQFRHLELQDYLAMLPLAPDAGSHTTQTSPAQVTPDSSKLPGQLNRP